MLVFNSVSKRKMSCRYLDTGNKSMDLKKTKQNNSGKGLYIITLKFMEKVYS